MKIRKLLTSTALAAALAIPSLAAHAQTAQTYNLVIPSGTQTYTDSSGDTDTLNIPSAVTIGTLTFTPVASGPHIAATAGEVDCSSGTTCNTPGFALTSGDKLLIDVAASSAIAATPITVSGGTGAISGCTQSASATSPWPEYLVTCSVSTSGTPTNIVVHFGSAVTWSTQRMWEIAGGSDHGNGASASGTGTSASVTTAAGANGQPSAGALIFNVVTSGLGSTGLTPTSGWQTSVNASGELDQYELNPSSGAVNPSVALSTSDSWISQIVAFQ